MCSLMNRKHLSATAARHERWNLLQSVPDNAVRRPGRLISHNSVELMVGRSAAVGPSLA